MVQKERNCDESGRTNNTTIHHHYHRCTHHRYPHPFPPSLITVFTAAPHHLTDLLPDATR